MSEATLWTPLLALLGVLIGIVGSLVTQVYLDGQRRKADERSLSQAIVGEISALVEIVRRRHYIEDLTALIEKLKAEGDSASLGWFRFSARGNYFAVYQANLARLGMLRDPKPGLVVQYYTQVSSVLEDIKDMDGGKTTPLSGLEELLSLFKHTDDLGRRLTGLPPRS